jgi:MFS family permease
VLQSKNLERFRLSREAEGAGSRAQSRGVILAALACTIATVSIVGVGLSLTMALLSVRLGEQGYSAHAIGLNPAAGGLATLFGAPFVPVAARWLGVKRVLFLALLIGALCLAAFALTDDYWAWLALRAIFGAALTALFVLSEYWINAIAPPERRGTVMGLYAASLASGFVAGPAILALVGTHGAAPFLAAIGLFIIAAMPIVMGSGDAPEIAAAPQVSVLHFLTGAPIATLAGFLHGAIETASMGLLPIYALHAGLSAETGAGFVGLFALGNVLFQIPIGLVSDLIDRRKLLFLIGLIGFLGALAIPLAGQEHILALCTLLVIWGGIVGGLYAVGLAHLGSSYRGAELASANAAFIMLYSLGMLGGPPIIGFGMDLLVPNGFFLSIAALLAVYLAIICWRSARLSLR